MLHDESSHTKDGEIGIQNANGAFQGMEMEVTNDGDAEQFWPLCQKGSTLGQSIGTIHNDHPKQEWGWSELDGPREWTKLECFGRSGSEPLHPPLKKVKPNFSELIIIYNCL